jgi:ribosome recycling factor
MAKVASKIAENAKIKIRLVRQDGMKDLKKDCANKLPRDDAIILDKKVNILIFFR